MLAVHTESGTYVQKKSDIRCSGKHSVFGRHRVPSPRPSAFLLSCHVVLFNLSRKMPGSYFKVDLAQLFSFLTNGHL